MGGEKGRFLEPTKLKMCGNKDRGEGERSAAGPKSKIRVQ